MVQKTWYQRQQKTQTPSIIVGVAATSPFFVSVGCIGIIPLSTIADLVLKSGTLPSLADAGGCVLIVAGFLVLNAFQGEVGEEE